MHHSLKLSVSALETDEVSLHGNLEAVELDLMIDDEMVLSQNPLNYSLSAQRLEDEILVSGSFDISFHCTCVRCLKPFDIQLDFPDWSTLLALTGEDKVEISGDFIDLIPWIREDVLLLFPQHPLCSPDCTVYRQPDRSQESHDEESSGDQVKPSPWTELDKLKLR